MAMNFLISAQQRDALLAYLVKRPFEEVAGAVAWLQQLPPAPPPSKDKEAE
jgi:hypothetical protein